MFDSGSARLKPYFEDILLAMADTIKAVPNKISISGHTDAKPYAGQGDFGNWELSANRANAARRALVAGSYPDPQVARVVGFASSQLFDHKDPFNPINRRIDIVVLTKKAQRAIEGDQPPPAPTPGAGAPGEVPSDPNAIPPGQEPLPAHELRQKLNLFDDGGVKDPTVPKTGT
jgi:chemotaxis protein MotB